MMKKLGIILLAVLLVAFSSACNKDTEKTASTDDGPKSKDEQVELTFMMWGNEAHQEVYNQLIAKFNEKHPNIKVKMESVPFPDYQQKITVLAAGRELPDVGWVAERMVPQFMENGILDDVSSFKRIKHMIWMISSHLHWICSRKTKNYMVFHFQPLQWFYFITKICS